MILQRIAVTHSVHLTLIAERKLKESAKQFIVLSPNVMPEVFTSVQDSGVLLTLRHLCEPRSRRTSIQEIWEAILEEFSRCNDIDFAYPTQRFYNNCQEGKTGAGELSPELETR